MLITNQFNHTTEKPQENYGMPSYKKINRKESVRKAYVNLRKKN
jgi:hypothetical protein